MRLEIYYIMSVNSSNYPNSIQYIPDEVIAVFHYLGSKPVFSKHFTLFLFTMERKNEILLGILYYTNHSLLCNDIFC